MSQPLQTKTDLNQVIREKLNALPEIPGVYLMKDGQGTIIYVGKAASLKNRVRSYFQNTAMLTPKTAALVAKIKDFDTIIVDSAEDALILESQLIKEHEPHYNIRLRDDKHYPYLQLTLGEEYPRLLVTRRAKNDGSRYFGPYVSSTAMNQALKVIRTIFPLRSCTGKSWNANHRACLNAHVGICLSPCEGKISKKDYDTMVQQVILFLSGKTKSIAHEIEQAMNEASRELRFEEAARLRDQLTALREVQRQQNLDMSAQGGSYDLVAVAPGAEQSVAQVFFVRQGKVVGREHYFLHSGESGEEELPLLLARFIQEFYAISEQIPAKIYLSVMPEDEEILRHILTERAQHALEFQVPQRGDKLRLLNLVEKNAQLLLSEYENSLAGRSQKNAVALEELRLALKLDKTPLRMECYDISHIQGTNTVASMVVFINGEADKSQYRRFKIKTVQGVDDFASLKEVIARRWQHGLKEQQEQLAQKRFACFPDLLVIDGGKGQLSAVCEQLALMSAKDVAIISLAKEEEEIFLPHQSMPIVLPRSSAALQLLQRLRDEAHRFAVSYHRNLRSKEQTASVLDSIPGVGPASRKRLLEAFGSVIKIQKATEEELSYVQGISHKTAKSVYDFFHPVEVK